jgi:catechol 2,3-dioxygenase-like lactoylglutathione lyase family enzyme
MITGLDHIVILVGDIADATRTYATLFARQPSWKSRREGMATVVFTLDNMMVEIIAAEGTGSNADRVRTAHAAQGDGLASLCFRVDDLPAMHRRLARVGLDPDPISDGGSRNELNGARLSWLRSRAATKATHGVRLFFLQRMQEPPHSEVSGIAPVLGIDHVVVSSHQPERAAALYGARLGLDMALDRSQADWGRLMFFRCGDHIVEVVQRPGHTDPEVNDKAWGATWRVADIDAARARLVAAGVDVSEVRAGRKPGTRVMSLKSGTCNVPTLFLERAVDKVSDKRSASQSA